MSTPQDTTTMTQTPTDKPRRYRIGNLITSSTFTTPSSSTESIDIDLDLDSPTSLLSPATSLAASSLRLRQDLAPFMEMSIPAGDPFKNASEVLGSADFEIDVLIPRAEAEAEAQGQGEEGDGDVKKADGFGEGKMLRESLAPFMEMSVRS